MARLPLVAVLLPSFFLAQVAPCTKCLVDIDACSADLPLQLQQSIQADALIQSTLLGSADMRSGRLAQRARATAVEGAARSGGTGGLDCSVVRDLLCFLLPLVAVAVVLGGWLWMQRLMSVQAGNASDDPMSQGSIAVQVNITGAFFALVDNICFSIVIPYSFDLIRLLGGTAALSGFYIGVSKLGTAFGSLSMFMVVQQCPDVWRKFYRAAFAACLVCNFVGTGTYAFVAFQLGGGPHEALAADVLLLILLSGRFVGGVGGGIRNIISRTLIVRLMPRPHRPAQMARFLFAIVLGVGFGPIVVCLAHAIGAEVAPGEAPHRRLRALGVAGLATTFGQMLLSSRLPSLSEPSIVDHEAASPPPASDGETSAAHPQVRLREMFVFSCLVFTTLRGLVVSGIEASTSMLLEVKYRWEIWHIGGAIGMAYLFTIPVKILHERCGSAFAVATCMKALILVAVLGCLLFFEAPAHLRKTLPVDVGPYLLLLADVLVFPSFYIADVICQGLMLQSTVPDRRSYFSANWTILFQSLLMDGFARMVGPSLARSQAHSYGQNCYALEQIGLTLAAALVAVWSILPHLGSSWQQAKLQS